MKGIPRMPCCEECILGNWSLTHLFRNVVVSKVERVKSYFLLGFLLGFFFLFFFLCACFLVQEWKNHGLVPKQFLLYHQPSSHEALEEPPALSSPPVPQQDSSCCLATGPSWQWQLDVFWDAGSVTAPLSGAGSPQPVQQGCI